MNAHDILDMIGDARDTYVLDAQQVRDRLTLTAKRKIAFVLLVAVMVLTLASCAVAAVIYGDSIQSWFTYYWEQITGQEMGAGQTAVIHELSQKIGASTTDGNLTITVDSATGSEDIYYRRGKKVTELEKTSSLQYWQAMHMARHMRKTPFPISSEAVLFDLLGSIPIPQHCKFFAGYASSGCFGVLRFNPCENEYIMLIRS